MAPVRLRIKRTVQSGLKKDSSCLIPIRHMEMTKVTSGMVIQAKNCPGASGSNLWLCQGCSLFRQVGQIQVPIDYFFSVEEEEGGTEDKVGAKWQARRPFPPAE